MLSTEKNQQSGIASKVAMQRVAASAAVSFKDDGVRTRLGRLYQMGSAKIRFPKVYGPQMEAVLINTAGGLTGGDQLNWDLRLGEKTNAVISTQACEKAYRSLSGTANVTTGIHLSADSELNWLPQETILYEGADLSRQFNVSLENGARFLAVEPLVLGREAMGESIETVSFRDRWRIHREEKLVFADDIRLVGAGRSVSCMNGMRAVASFLFVGPEDREQLTAITGKLREICSAPFYGFSAFGGKITGRILCPDSYSLRQELVRILGFMRGTDLPRVWRI